SNGSDPGTSGSNARSDGSARAFTEDQLKNVIKSVWDNGGDPSMVMLGSFNKQKLSGFTG
ncbi:MAG TPA: head protein, partial [Maribacter sp.]|nr:head protein [Maribacter sp.]